MQRNDNSWYIDQLIKDIESGREYLKRLNHQQEEIKRVCPDCERLEAVKHMFFTAKKACETAIDNDSKQLEWLRSTTTEGVPVNA